MPQETNFNVSPYYDDFDESKNFHQVLFKPSYPVQARELTTLQTILKNQIERFGNHFFKEGSVVIPGSTNYININCVEVDSDFAGIPVSSYANKLEGIEIKGRTSNITARVIKVIQSSESERGSITLYINYLNSSDNLVDTSFFDGETLEVVEDLEISSGIFISSGEGFSSTKISGSTSLASAFSIEDGIYYIRGSFVNVSKDLLLLDQYSSTPSYRIGLKIEESIVNYYEDQSFFSNLVEILNLSAPGAA
jgi:hypothetical protein